MKFEVDKFLTLTALLAGAATVVVACSSSDTKPPTGTGGTGGSAGTATSAGSGGKASAGESAGGAGGATESGAGAPTGMGGAPEGGAPEGGAGNDTCIADLVGEGGAAAEGTTPCDVWGSAGSPDCGQEFGNFASQLCNDLLFQVRPAVLSVFNTCVSGVGDVCNQSGIQDCADALIGKGCVQDGTAAACAAVIGTCTDGTINNCPALLNLTTADAQSNAEDCMDPAGNTYDSLFAGTCEARLVACLHFSL